MQGRESSRTGLGSTGSDIVHYFYLGKKKTIHYTVTYVHIFRNILPVSVLSCCLDACVIVTLYLLAWRAGRRISFSPSYRPDAENTRYFMCESCQRSLAPFCERSSLQIRGENINTVMVSAGGVLNQDTSPNPNTVQRTWF